MLSQATFQRGVSLQIFPMGERAWGAIELKCLDSKLSIDRDCMYLPGDSNLRDMFSYRRSIKMEIEASDGEIMHFESFEILEKWLKTKCNKLWPNCGFCGRRYVADEVTCSGCGGPAGE